jgi:hypothetical protein
MIFRAMLTIIACSAATLAAADSPALTGESPAARAARYYAAGLELPLMQLRRGALLTLACTTRLRSACTKEQRAFAHNHTLALLDELTLFPQRPAVDPVAGVNRAADLRDEMAATSAALLTEANAYDRQLLVRYGAALRTCPGDYDAQQYGHSLDALTAVELRDFQGVPERDYATVLVAMAAARQDAAEALRALPAEDCAAILDVGQLLMELMNSKLQPWTHDDRRIASQYRQFDFNDAMKPAPAEAPPPGLVHSVTGNFITVVATELQLKAHPETAPRIKAIAEAEGIPEPR